MKFLLQFFTWWNGETLGTRFFTWRKGERVGEDEFGNVYYQSHDKKRRWVIYKDYSDATTVSADWHGWLHHTFDNRPEDNPLPRRDWEQAHQPNMTGTAAAYAPPGSMYAKSGAKAYSDYEAWSPDA